MVVSTIALRKVRNVLLRRTIDFIWLFSSRCELCCMYSNMNVDNNLALFTSLPDLPQFLALTRPWPKIHSVCRVCLAQSTTLAFSKWVETVSRVCCDPDHQRSGNGGSEIANQKRRYMTSLTDCLSGGTSAIKSEKETTCIGVTGNITETTELKINVDWNLLYFLFCQIFAIRKYWRIAFHRNIGLFSTMCCTNATGAWEKWTINAGKSLEWQALI